MNLQKRQQKHSSFLIYPLYYKYLDDRLNHNQHCLLQHLAYTESVGSTIKSVTQSELKNILRDKSNRFKEYIIQLIAGGYISVFKSFNSFHNYYVLNSIPQLFATRFITGMAGFLAQEPSVQNSKIITPNQSYLLPLSTLLYDIIKEKNTMNTSYDDYFSDERNILTDRLNSTVPISGIFPDWENFAQDFSQIGKSLFPDREKSKTGV